MQDADKHGLDAAMQALRSLFDTGDKDRLFGTVELLLGKALSDNDRLNAQLLELRRKLWGPKTEHVDPNQLQLALEELRKQQGAEHEAADTSEPNAAIVSVPLNTSEPSRKAARRGRRPLPAHLPRKVTRIAPTKEQMAELGERPDLVGVEVSEVLDFVPASLFVRRFERETWSGNDGVSVTAPAAAKLVDKGMIGTGLAADIVTSKYREAMPLARQSRSLMERYPIDLHRNTMVDVVAAVADCLAAIAKRIRLRAFASYVFNADDTHLPVRDDGLPGKCRRGHLWVVIGDARWVYFQYTADWTKESASAVVGERIGYMQVDAYKGYDALFRERPNTLEIGCLMHVRRKFHEAFVGGDLRAAQAIEMIRALYAIEALAKTEGDTPEQRKHRREQDSFPLLVSFRQWLDELAPQAVPGTSLHKAIGYALNQWIPVLRAFEDGRLEVDNGIAERELRGPCIGRRNWLFAGSEEGAERAAIINTVVSTAIRHGVDPWLYIKDVLDKLVHGWPNARIDELLPDKWAELHRETAQAAVAAELATLQRSAVPASPTATDSS